MRRSAPRTVDALRCFWMCFELDSLPPIPVLSGGAPVRSEDLTLEAADGNELAAFAAIPDEPGPVGRRRTPRRPRPLPLLRGARAALRRARLSRRRLRLLRPHRRRGEARRRVPVHGSRRADDARGHPAGRPGRGRVPRAPRRAAAARTIFTVGFCFGGRNSWLAAAGGHGLAGAIGFYGSTVERNGAPGPTQRAAEFEAPILALQAGDDANILPEHNAAFEAALTAAGVEHELVVYDGAPHSFFDRKFEEHADASADAWERVLAFIAQHAPPAADAPQTCS